MSSPKGSNGKGTYGGAAPGMSAYTYRDSCVTLEVKRYFLAVNGKPLRLTRTEFRIAACLIAHIGGVTRLEDLWKAAWDPTRLINRKLIQVMMSRVRAKLLKAGLRVDSVVDIGYILTHDRCCSNK